MSSSTTLGAKGGVGDTPWFCVLPRAKNPTGDDMMHVYESGGQRDGVGS